MLQDLLGNFVPFLKKTDSLVAGIIGTAGCVGLWGYLLYQGRGRSTRRGEKPVAAIRHFQPDVSRRGVGTGYRGVGENEANQVYLGNGDPRRLAAALHHLGAVSLKLFSTNPQMEGFFFMAGEYKAKIAVIGSDVSAQQVAQMQHIMVNNYTNAGLSILFLLVVYSIIFYGIRALPEAAKPA